MNKYPEIIPLKYGESVLPENMIFPQGNSAKLYPIIFQIYLVKTESHLILVDAGCETLPGFHMKNFIGSRNALLKAGISAEDITDVIITHSHHDHIECVKYFHHAKIYIQKDEYELGKNYFLPNQNIFLFETHTTITDCIDVCLIGGHSKGSCIVQIDTTPNPTIIVGDECYLRKNIEKKIPTGSSVCPQKSLNFIQRYSSSPYKILLSHDI